MEVSGKNGAKSDLRKEELVIHLPFLPVELEMRRQKEIWGIQHHRGEMWMTILMEEVGEAAKSFLEQDFDNARIELVQVAAVALSALEDMNLRWDKNKSGT